MIGLKYVSGTRPVKIYVNNYAEANPAIIAKNIIKINKAKLTHTLINAPSPAFLAFLGSSFFQTIYKISPTTGIKNPSTAHQADPLSLVLLLILLVAVKATPQLGHITALGSTDLPQLGQ